MFQLNWHFASREKKKKNQKIEIQDGGHDGYLGFLIGAILSTVDSRYLDLAYLEYPLISKWKSGPCLNMKI